MIDVSDRAREAASKLMNSNSLAILLRSGGDDGHCYVQAFAAFERDTLAGQTERGEVERLREALSQILHCTPANTNFYDCGDPFEIARAALNKDTTND